MAKLSVVINTYDGGEVLPRALRSVLSQDLTDTEVVVADDGSPTSPEDLVAELFPDAAIRVVTHANAGLSAARNLGARATSGELLLWLDDDDELMPGALAELRGLCTDMVGIASGGVEVVEVGSGGPPGRRVPEDMGAELDHRVASNLAGSFVIAREVFDAVGGFDEQIRCNHQRELFLRAIPWCTANGWEVRSTPTPVMRMHRKPPGARPRNEAARLQDCIERMVDKHRDRLALNPAGLAAALSNAGVAAVRNGDLRSARRHLRDAARIRPGLQSLGRLGIVLVPPLARRVWRPLA